MIPGVSSITTSYADQLIDFAPTESMRRAGISDLQRDGAVALFNMLVRNGVAYLADEVGMGKTYIGLAVMHLLRYQKPDARILVITPRRNIQEKWASDLASFVKQNWRRADHRVKTPQGSPDWPTLTPDRLLDWVRDVHLEDAHDTVLRMSSFSLGVEEIQKGKTSADQILGSLPMALQQKMRPVLEAGSQANFASCIRELIGQVCSYDLIIVDESHNLKHGYRKSEPSSIRNETMHHLFGGGEIAQGKGAPWLLMLSATPMENGDPLSLVRQFEVFGREAVPLRPPNGVAGEPVPLKKLAETESLVNQRALQKRLVVRRVGELRFNDGARYTRNMYRREWRAGGVDSPDKPMKAASPSERLVNAVLQKNIFELLQSESGGRFRIGALESFEVYSGVESTLSGDSENNKDNENSLQDQRLIARLCESYRQTFFQEVPHPKLNAVAEMLGKNIRDREKVLVFVRRVATTNDLASRASQAYDQELLSLFRSVVVESEFQIIDELASVWNRKRAARDYIEDGHSVEALSQQQTPSADVEDQEGESVSEAVPSLFTWLFRGEHRYLKEFPNIFSGRRLREQLEASSRFCLVLEENYVDWALGRPSDVLGSIVATTGYSRQEVVERVGQFVPDDLNSLKNFRRSFHSIQYGALSWMLTLPAYKELHDKLKILIEEVFDRRPSDKQASQADHGLIVEMLSVKGVYPALSRAPKGSPVWKIVARGAFERVDENADFDFRKALRRREQIRHCQVALLRHGAPLVDLYLACLANRGGALRVEGQNFSLSANESARLLVERWGALSLDENQFRASGAWELHAVNENFDLIKKLNFPGLDSVRDELRPLDAPFIDGQEPRSDKGAIRSVRRVLNQELAGQSPTAAAKGGQTDERRHRITTHFRMPGMPWVIVATSVYEEGVDLHTFCRTVVHHGVSHTASSVEQRTGRVDRIGGKVQRETAVINGAHEFSDDRKIQSLFPYQNDTFEKFQVRRVLENCNRFLEALHEPDAATAEDDEMSITDKLDVPPQITRHLSSPFDVNGSPWLQGRETVPDGKSDFIPQLYLEEAARFEIRLKSRLPEVFESVGQGLERHYYVGKRQIKLLPKSHREGDHLIIDVHIDHKSLATFDCVANGSDWHERVINAIEPLL